MQPFKGLPGNRYDIITGKKATNRHSTVVVCDLQCKSVLKTFEVKNKYKTVLQPKSTGKNRTSVIEYTCVTMEERGREPVSRKGWPKMRTCATAQGSAPSSWLERPPVTRQKRNLMQHARRGAAPSVSDPILAVQRPANKIRSKKFTFLTSMFDFSEMIWHTEMT